MHRGHYTYNICAVLCSLQRFYMHYFINASVLRKENYLHFKDEKPKVQRVKGLAQGQVRHLAKWRSQDYQVQKVHTKALPTKTEKLEGFYYEDHYYLAGAPVKCPYPGPTCACGPVTRTVERGPGNANRHQGTSDLVRWHRWQQGLPNMVFNCHQFYFHVFLSQELIITPQLDTVRQFYKAKVLTLKISGWATRCVTAQH